MKRFTLFFAVVTWGFLCADEPYLQVTRNPVTGTECLQVAIRSFVVESTGHLVRLVGVSHVGTQSYYEGLQEVLNAADVVLFEGVDGDSPAFRNAAKERLPERSSLQENLARALGLVFQLQHIDYSPEHFVNSDLSSLQLMALFEGEDLPEEQQDAKVQLEHLMDTMEQTTVSGKLGASVLEFLQGRPGWSRGMRWAMVNTLGAVRGDVTSYVGFPESMRVFMEVLIDRRNDAVIADIRDQLDRLEEGKTIAVFYGAAHMHDFHQRLIREFAAVETSVEWHDAFCANLQRSGLNILQKALVEGFVMQQVRTLEVMSGGSAADND